VCACWSPHVDLSRKSVSRTLGGCVFALVLPVRARCLCPSSQDRFGGRVRLLVELQPHRWILAIWATDLRYMAEWRRPLLCFPRCAWLCSCMANFIDIHSHVINIDTYIIRRHSCVATCLLFADYHQHGYFLLSMTLACVDTHSSLELAGIHTSYAHIHTYYMHTCLHAHTNTHTHTHTHMQSRWRRRRRCGLRPFARPCTGGVTRLTCLNSKRRPLRRYRTVFCGAAFRTHFAYTPHTLIINSSYLVAVFRIFCGKHSLCIALHLYLSLHGKKRILKNEGEV